MKRIFAVAIALIFLFSSCTVQENVDPQVFLARLTEADKDVNVAGKSVFYEGNSCVAFFDYAGKRFVIEQFCTDAGIVSEICLSSESADKKLFEKCVGTLINVYAPQEKSVEIIENLRAEGYSYHETQWYEYSAYSDGKTHFFSVKNKKLSPEKEEKLTLKPE